jgi:putative DNA primase/helicase
MNDTAAVKQGAMAAYEAGLCIIPPKEDGTKRPDGEWKHYQEQRPSFTELERWYSNGRTGLGSLCGRVSLNLETLEFEELRLYEAYKQLAEALGLGDLIARIEAGYLEASPGGGIHWLYRCIEIGGNTKLAKRLKQPEERLHPEDNEKTLIETRGEGGYIILAPTYGKVHPSGQPYQLLQGGFNSIATITPEERSALFELARTFDRIPKPRVHEPTGEGAGPAGSRPGDIYNAEANWADILEPCGWQAVYEKEGVTYWRRPGKELGTSASTNYADSGLLYVFSTSTSFQAERGYSKFAAYTLLEHDGDYHAAAQALHNQGYGGSEQQGEPWSEGLGELPQVSSPPTLPADMIPECFRPWIEDIARQGCFPLAMVAIPAIEAASAVIGRKLAIRPWQFSDYTVIVNL